MDAAVDFNKIYDMVEPLYCADNGRPSVDPVALFKIVLIQHLYGLGSLRRTAEAVRANIYYRWFLGYRLQEETPHFSTISYNFRHRFTPETVDQIFNYTGLAQVTNWVKLKFAAMNLKKFAKWSWRDTRSNCTFSILAFLFPQYAVNPRFA